MVGIVAFFVNLIIAALAFFLVRYLLSLIVPEGKDKDKIVNIVALLTAIVVFFSNLAHYLAQPV